MINPIGTQDKWESSESSVVGKGGRPYDPHRSSGSDPAYRILVPPSAFHLGPLQTRSTVTWNLLRCPLMSSF